MEIFLKKIKAPELETSNTYTFDKTVSIKPAHLLKVKTVSANKTFPRAASSVIS